MDIHSLAALSAFESTFCVSLALSCFPILCIHALSVFLHTLLLYPSTSLFAYRSDMRLYGNIPSSPCLNTLPHCRIYALSAFHTNRNVLVAKRNNWYVIYNTKDGIKNEFKPVAIKICLRENEYEILYLHF